jgi:adenylate cyclase
VARRYAEALEAFARISRPDHTHHAFMAAACALTGDDAAATAHAEEVMRRQPEFAVDAYLGTLHYKRDSDRTHHRDGLLKAGLAS